jgi:hypothetical protein
MELYDVQQPVFEKAKEMLVIQSYLRRRGDRMGVELFNPSPPHHVMQAGDGHAVPLAQEKCMGADKPYV